MFDFDSGKLLIVGIVALVVIGPKDLPRVLRQVGQMVTRVRRMAGEFQGQFMEAMTEADLQDLRSEVAKIKDTAKIDVDFNPVRDAKHELMTAMNGTGSNPSIMGPEPADAVPSDTMPAVPRASKTFPSLDLPETPALAAAGIAPATLPEPEPSAAVDNKESEATSGPRRRIQLNRRAPLRFAGRAGSLPQRSRNILPARLDTPDR